MQLEITTTPHRIPANPRWLVRTIAGSCLLAALGAWAGHEFGEELTAGKLPAAPWWVVLSGAIAGIGWSAWTLRRAASAVQAAIGAAGALALLAGSLILVPHNLLFAIVWILQLINPGHNVFGATPGAEVVLPLIGHLLAVAAAMRSAVNIRASPR